MNDQQRWNLKHDISVIVLNHVADKLNMSFEDYCSVYDSEEHEKMLNKIMQEVQPTFDPRSIGKTIKAFMECVKIAKTGQTFIYLNPDFVAIDRKTWLDMKSKIDMPVIYKDELSTGESIDK